MVAAGRHAGLATCSCAVVIVVAVLAVFSFASDSFELARLDRAQAVVVTTHLPVIEARCAAAAVAADYAERARCVRRQLDGLLWLHERGLVD